MVQQKKYKSHKIWTAGNASELLYTNFSPAESIGDVNIQIISREKISKGKSNNKGEFYLKIMDIKQIIAYLKEKQSKELDNYKSKDDKDVLSFIRKTKKATRTMRVKTTTYNGVKQVEIALSYKPANNVDGGNSIYYVNLNEFIAFLEFAQELMMINIQKIIFNGNLYHN